MRIRVTLELDVPDDLSDDQLLSIGSRVAGDVNRDEGNVKDVKVERQAVHVFYNEVKVVAPETTEAALDRIG